MKKTFLLFLSVFLISGVAAATEAVARKMAQPGMPGQTCAMTENASAGVSFNSTESDLSKIRPFLEDKIEKIRALALDSGMETIEVQSMNYSVYANNSGGCNAANTGSYNFSGNLNFVIGPADKAPDFIALLAKEGYQVNLNVNSYRQCQ